MRKTLLAAAVLGTLVVVALALSLRPVQQAIVEPVPVQAATVSFGSCSGVSQEQKAACLAEAVLTSYEATGDLPALMAGLDKAIQENPGLAGVNCHGTLHDVGQRMFQTEGNSALDKGAAVCSGGYYHGVLQAGGDVQRAMDVCRTLQDDAAQGDCSHGAGHAIWLATENLDEGVRICKGEKYDACIQGVFMEISAAEGRKPSALKHCLDPALDKETRISCYSGLVGDVTIVHPEAGPKWCAENATTEEQGANECWRNVGNGLGTRSNEVAPVDDKAAVAEVQKYCGENAHCMQAAGDVLDQYFGRAEARTMLCAALQGVPVKEADRPALTCLTP